MEKPGRRSRPVDVVVVDAAAELGTVCSAAM
jgi:hypothetical protein